MPDPQQQVNALAAGEIDVIEQPPHDLIPILKKEKSVTLFNWNPLGHQFIYRMNRLQPPFNNPKIREAALLTIAPGGLPQGDRRRARVLQGLHGGLRLRHAQCASMRPTTCS